VSGPPPSVDTADLSLHFPLNTVALQRGGLVRSVMRRANVLAASGAFAAVWIEVLAYQQRLEYDVDRLKRSGHLHEKVQVRSVLYSLDDSLPPEVGTTRSGRTSPKALAASEMAVTQLRMRRRIRQGLWWEMIFVKYND